MADVLEGEVSKQEGFMMTIACPPQKKAPKKKKVEEQIEILTLSHFTKSPRIDFGSLKPGASCIRSLCIKNPEEFSQHVDIEKFPYKKGFSVEESSFDVDAYSDLLLKLIWMPEESGNCREMILFKVEGVYRLQAYVFGRVEEPPKAKSKKRKTWLSTSKAPSVQPRLAVQACFHGKENCPPRRKVSPSPSLQEKPAFSPQTTPTKETKRRRVWDDMEKQKVLAVSAVEHEAEKTSSKALQFTPTGMTGSPHTPKYFPPLLGTIDGSEVFTTPENDHEFPMVQATPEIIEARLPRRQCAAAIKRDTIVLDREESEPSPDDIRRETVVISQSMPRVRVSRETIVIPRGNMSPLQEPCVSPRVAKLRTEYSPNRGQQKKKSSKNVDVVTKETTELIEMFQLQCVEEEEVVVETVTTVETDVDGDVSWTVQDGRTIAKESKGDWVHSSSKTTSKSSKQQVTSHLYVEEVFESVIEIREDCSENSINVSPPKTISKSDVKRPVTNVENVETPERFNIVLSKPLQRGSFSSTPIVSSQALGRDSFDAMTDTKPVSPVTLEMLSGPQNPNSRRISNLTVTKAQPSQLAKEENVELKRNLFGPVNSDGDDIAPLTDLSVGWQENGTHAKNPFEKSPSEVETRRLSNITVTKPKAMLSRLPGHFELEGQLEDSIFMQGKPEDQPEERKLSATFKKSPSKFPMAGVSALMAKARRSPVKAQVPITPETEFVCESSEPKKPSSETFYVFTAPTGCVTPVRGIPSVDSSSIQRSLKRTAKSKKHRRSITHTIDENEANLSLLERPSVDTDCKSEELDENSPNSPDSGEEQEMNLSELAAPMPPKEPSILVGQAPSLPLPDLVESTTEEMCLDEPAVSLFQESVDVRPLSLADLTEPSNMDQKDANRKRRSPRRSPRRSCGRVTKAVSPTKASRSPPKVVRNSRGDRQYDKPWATGAQKKFAKSTIVKKEGDKKAERNTARLSRTTKIDRTAVKATVNSGLSVSRSVRSFSQSMRKSVGLQQTKLQLMKPRAMSVAALPKHPLAHAAKNMYYDERWMEKEERGFVCWLNFILTPPDEHFEAVKPKRIDAGSIALDRTVSVKLAPSKETLSLRAYTVRKNLNTLRSRACRLLQSEAFVRVHHKLEIEIECGRLAIRPDRKVHADLGLKQGILDMLLCYNPLWLRIGLEAVYGEVVPVSTNTDVYGLSRFVLTRLLQNPDISQQYSHPTVPHLYRPGYDKATSQFMLKKFLLLVMLLDHAKRQRLIKWDPCLFCKDAEFKSSRELLINFAKDYLSGEGDVTKHLSYLGYTVGYIQHFIEEYNYAVANLATDLRDGVKLTRIAELLTKDEMLIKDMRVPAISRLQKIHNTEVAFRGLLANGVQMSSNRGEITPRDIVDGQREKTLQLLWKIIFNFQVSLVLSEQMLKDEIRILRLNWRLKTQLADFLQDSPSLGLPRDGRESMEPELYFRDPKLQLLLQWCKAVCAYYKVKVENFTVSFSDGRVLCMLLHHYHPGLLPYEEINQKTCQTQDASTEEVDDEFDLVTDMIDPAVMESLIANEKANFKLLFSKVSELGGVPMMLKISDVCNTIPDEKVVITYVSYLCCRLLDIRQETRAARIIQAAYRRHMLKKHAAHYEVKIQAIVKIQRAVRTWLARHLATRRLRAAIMIQCWWRRHHAKKCLEKLKQEKQERIRQEICMRAAVMIQCWLRRHHAKRCLKKLKQEKQERIRQEICMRAAVRIQRFIRCRLIRRRRAAVTIQCCWRRHISRRCLLRLKHEKEVRIQHEKEVTAAVMIQRNVRLWMTRCLTAKRVRAAVTLQCWWRRYLAEQEMVKLIHEKEIRNMYQAVSKIQGWWRLKLATDRQRSGYLRMKVASIQIQTWFRAVKARNHFVEVNQASVTIQKWYRSCQKARQDRANYMRVKGAVVILQTSFRAWQQKKKYFLLKHSVFVIQRNYKMYRMLSCMKSLAEEYRRNKAATTIQSWYKGRLQLQRFTCMRNSVLVIQRMFRQHQEQVWNQLRRTAATLILQTHWRRYACRKSFQRKQRAVIVIQRQFRRHSCVVKYQAVKLAVVLVENWYLARLTGRRERAKYVAQRAAALKMQAMWRGYSALKSWVKKKNAVLKLQQWYRSCVQHQRMSQAATILQRRWRARQIGHHCHREYIQKRTAIIALQRIWRAKLTAKSCKEQYSRQKCAVICLQRHWRARQLAKRCQEEFNRQKCAALSIQKHWHARQLAMQCREEFAKQKCAALILQRQWRARQLTKQCLEEFARQKCAALSLQKHWRARQLGKQCREDFLKQKCAAVSLQKHWRARQLGKRCHEEFNRQKCAAMSLQKHWRARQLGKRCHEEFHRRKCAALSVQKYWHARQLGKQCQEDFLKQKCAALALQKQWRARQLGKQCQEDFLKQKCAALYVQKHWRARQLGKQCQEDFLKQKCAALVFQKHWRARQLGKQCQEDFLKQKCAALALQKHWRARQLGKQCQEDFLKKKCAAVSLQKHWRARQLGKQCREDFLKQKCAALVFQKHWRARQLGKQCQEDFLKQKCAALALQKHWRARQLGKHCQEDFLKKKCAAVSLQKHWRARQIGNRCHEEFQRQKCAALALQKHWRARQLGKQYREDFLKQKCSVMSLQKHWRARQLGKRCHEEFNRQKCAAMSLQKHWRARQLGKQCQEEFHRQKCAALSVQKHWRARQLGKQCQEDFLKQKCAALALQKQWRARQLGKQCQEEFLKQKCAALSLQKHWRARQYGQQCREELSKQKWAALTLQRHWHARQLGKKCQVEFKRQKCAALCILKQWQARKIRKQCQEEFQRLKCAASTLQKHWRARQLTKQCYEEFTKQKCAALSLQRHWRARQLGKKCHQEFQKQKCAAVTLQKHWQAKLLGRRCSVEFARQRCAALSLQRQWRARQLGQRQRQIYCRQKQAVILLQRHWRARQIGRQCRKDYIAKKQSAILLQKHYRALLSGRQCRALVSKMRQDKVLSQKHAAAAVVLQRRWRALLIGRRCREEFTKIKEADLVSRIRTRAVIVLQKHWRALLIGRQCREEFLMMKEAAQLRRRLLWAVIVVQRRWRALLTGRQCRVEFVRLKDEVYALTRRYWAVTVLQSHWRALLLGRQCRQEFAEIKEAVQNDQRCTWAATVLQRRWRALLIGRQCREEFSQRKEAAFVSQRRLWAVTVLQRRWKALLIGRQCREEVLRMKEAIRTSRKRTHAATVLQSRWRALLLGRQCREEFSRMREAVCMSRRNTWAVTVLQRRWRSLIIGRKCREEFARMKEAVHMSRRRTCAIIVLQRRWKAFLLGRQCREEFAKKREAVHISRRRTWAVTVLQRRWRALLIGRQCRVEFVRMREAVHVSRRHTWAATVLQRRWRAVLIGRQCRKEFAVLQETVRVKQRHTWAVIILQRRWRALLLGRKCREDFAKMKEAHRISRRRTWAVTVIQRRWRALLVGRQCRVEFIRRREDIHICRRRMWAVTVLQRRWRSLLIGRQCRKEFANMKEAVHVSRQRTWAVTVIQRRWRALLIGRQCRKQFVIMKEAVRILRRRTWAVTVLQRRLRALLIGRQCREEFARMKENVRVKRRRTLAVIILQRRWRALLIGRKCRQEFVRMKEADRIRRRRTWAVTILQRRWRALLIGRQCRREYARILHAWEICQRYMRDQAHHKQKITQMQKCISAATVLQRRWKAVQIGRQCRKEYIVLRERRREEIRVLEAARRRKLMTESALKIQALWRGYVLRKNTKNVKMKEARKRIHKVTSAVREEDRLGNRTSWAIENLLKYKHVSQVLRAVTDLDVSTRHSWVCCERLVASNALPILFTLISVCNRSLPHMEIISYTVNVLLNLAKYEKTVSSVFLVEGCLDYLLELLKIYREKGVIFTRTCTLIGLLCQDESRAQMTREKPGFVDKLLSIHKLCLRKHDLEIKRRLVKTSINKVNPFATHRLCPQWFARRYSMHEIDDPLEAMRYVLNSLGMLPEEPPSRKLPVREICPRYPRTLVVPTKKH